jgi:hypothetical protein
MANKNFHIAVIPATRQRTIADIRRLSPNSDKLLKDIITNVAYNIQKDAKTSCPYQYGFLRSSIYVDNRGKINTGNSEVTPGSPRNRQLLIPGIGESDSNGMNAIIGSAMDYAEKMDIMKPYLTPAFEKHSRKADELFKKALDRLTKK